MAQALVSRARVTRSVNDLPLTPAAMKLGAPAIFADKPSERVSSKYIYIPTHTILSALEDEGFRVYEVAQARPHKKYAEREPYAKHMLRLRPEAPKKRSLRDSIPELVLLNAHDGTARYTLFVGMYRFICANGLIVGTTYGGINIRHTGTETSRIVTDESMKLTNDFGRVVEMANDMKRVELKAKKQRALAEAALHLRWPHDNAPIGPDHLLAVRREADAANDLWTLYNRIQENLMTGGMETRSFMFNRRSHVRPIQQIGQTVDINRQLWDLAAGLLK